MWLKDLPGLHIPFWVSLSVQALAAVPRCNTVCDYWRHWAPDVRLRIGAASSGPPCAWVRQQVEQMPLDSWEGLCYLPAIRGMTVFSRGYGNDNSVFPDTMAHQKRCRLLPFTFFTAPYVSWSHLFFSFLPRAYNLSIPDILTRLKVSAINSLH